MEKDRQMSKEELVDFLIDNFSDEYGNLNLDYLDFSKVKGTVSISHTRTGGNLYQFDQEVNGDLIQSHQKAKGNIYQYHNKTPINTCQAVHQAVQAIKDKTNLRIHNIKIQRKYYDDILTKNKNFEIRKNDRDYQVGDLLYFTIIDENELTQDKSFYPIKYILKDVPEFGLKEGYCILGI